MNKQDKMFAPTDRDTAGLRHTQESAHAQLVRVMVVAWITAIILG
ncbi:MAG: hypothetical protein WCA39_14395 [Nitrososphaeraceae archaeon]